MISLQIESFFKTLSATELTEFFLYLIVGVFLLALLLSIFERHQRFVNYAPSLMTSLGILGTFVGIVIGLLGFDTQNIEQSIPVLLDGLKTAFITSVFGLIGAVLFNFIDSFIVSLLHKDKRLKDGVTSEDIYAVLDKKLQLAITQNENLNNIKTLITTTQQEVSNGQKQIESFFYQYTGRQQTFEDKLFVALREFSEMLSRSATQQIIEALKDVIVDFNNKLTEQFGENFKALDASVQKLVVWQEQYKNQVEVMSEQFSQSVHALVETKDAVSGIWKECESIPKVMNDLREVLDVNQHQIKELDRHLEAFVQMRDEAIKAVPTIQEQVGNIAQQLSDSSSNLQQRLLETSEKLTEGANSMKVSLDEAAESVRNSVQVSQVAFGKLSHQVKQTSEELSTALTDTSKELHENAKEMFHVMKDSASSLEEQIGATVRSWSEQSQNVRNQLLGMVDDFKEHGRVVTTKMNELSEELAQEVNKLLTKSQHSFDSHLRETVQKTGDSVNSQLEVLESAMAKELSAAINELGGNLTKITARFVSDYDELLQKTQRILNATNNKF